MPSCFPSRLILHIPGSELVFELGKVQCFSELSPHLAQQWLGWVSGGVPPTAQLIFPRCWSWFLHHRVSMESEVCWEARKLYLFIYFSNLGAHYLCDH